jgi:hypothetical protein
MHRKKELGIGQVFTTATFENRTPIAGARNGNIRETPQPVGKDFSQQGRIRQVGLVFSRNRFAQPLQLVSATKSRSVE